VEDDSLEVDRWRWVEDEEEDRVNLDGMLQVVDLGLELVIALKKLVLLDDMLQLDCLLMRDRELEQWKRYRDLSSGYWMLRLVFGVERRWVLMKLVRRM
jgi:hypothetical protein